jgi:RNA polymerase sigma-70 factor (ECF subfamily)
MTSLPCDSDGLVKRLRAGDKEALAELFSFHRQRLWQMVSLRLDRRLYGRVDADDILQEAYLDALDRTGHFMDNDRGSFFVWIRMIVSQTLVNVHRRHMGADMRDAKRDVSIFGRRHSQATSTLLALHLLGHLTSPSEAAIRDERAMKLEQAIDDMTSTDREILTLRHFELLTNNEAAEELGIGQKAASTRYARALRRLKVILSKVDGLSMD